MTAPSSRERFIVDIKILRNTVIAETVDADRYSQWFTEQFDKLDYIPKPLEKHLAANTLISIVENNERKQAIATAHNRTRDEWEALEQAFYDGVTPFSREDAHDFYMSQIERAKDHYLRLQSREMKVAALRKLWRMCDEFPVLMAELRDCRYVFCDGVFKPRHGHQQYCCEAHKRSQAKAEIQFRTTSRKFRAGTYLPTREFVPKRAKSLEKARYKYEIISDDEKNYQIRAEITDFCGTKIAI